MQRDLAAWTSLRAARLLWSGAMLRKGLEQPALRALSLRCLSTSASLQHALPAVAPDAKTGGFLSSLFGGGSRVETPMTDPLPGVHLPAHTAAPAQPPTTDFTTLSNGVKIASENIPVRAAGHR